MGLPARSTVTPKVLEKAVWAGANNHSYPLAAKALEQLAESELSPKQIRRMVSQIGQARLAERDEAVEQLKQMPLPKRRAGQRAPKSPQVAVISMDGGRDQRRDNFRSEPTRQARGKHWRETKVGCLLSMESRTHEGDPTPEFPEWLATSEAVAELAKIAEKTTSDQPSPTREERPPPAAEQLGYEAPELISREVVATSAEAEHFGWQLEARAWELGFPAAERKALICDGLKVNWTIWRKHFRRATPILDLMHALSYAWSAAQAAGEGALYRHWAKWLWQGKITQVLDALDQLQKRLGPPPENTPADDSRQRIDRALTYYRNNQKRMNYPQYRQQGLPLTSSHIESTIKQVNQRIKGTEKFWRRDSGDAVLQLRADSLSDSQPLTDFWLRWQSQQTGSNHYQTAT